MSTSPPQASFDYLIIGAGPAGLQMAYFLHQAGRSYLVLEAAPSAGSFFDVYPRHRTLLSINKIHNRYEEPDFNLRHDWNSLVSNDERLLFKHHSQELFPHADDLAHYLRDFASRTGVSIRYNTRVHRVSLSEAGFRVAVSDEELDCRTLIVATGAVAENVPTEIEGIELATTYATHPLDPSHYENKRVAIIGGGNSAFEVANHLAGSAATIHVLVRDPVKHAWQTHFPGDLRAVNNDIIDMYQLKSLHATLGFRPQKITKNVDGSFCVSMAEDCPHWSKPCSIYVDLEYDEVIACTGWRYVPGSIFDDATQPELSPCGRYPVLSHSWESSVPGMYFIGTSMAARDKRAASAFIHGFRYNIRTLFRLLEEQHEAARLGDDLKDLDTTEGLLRLCARIIDRVSTSSALYQMNAVLADVIEIRGSQARYIEELPIALVPEHEDFGAADFVVTVSLEYGFGNYPSTAQSIDFIHPSDVFRGECSAFLHPVLRIWKAGERVAEHHLGESLIIRYDHFFSPNSFVEGYDALFRRANEHNVANFLDTQLGVLDSPLPEERFSAEIRDRAVRLWTPEEIEKYEASIRAAAEDDRQKSCRT